ncbi:arsenite S-adenosylmethyltransferase [Cohnella xylanilytica]|mgnify:FL=1|jgi:Methylase involved in ubiquinone/menaquinone biosynthesis|uniref:Arsenite methyltransferase n=3 Tax=Paenibacillaceae TaxID=186822 RepID=A0A5D0CPG1_9BACL|nr:MULTISPECIES: arsenite methyltransferase [Paenibacillaceae]MBB6694433.1 arsenite methyltransferase [Cohnella xylanilytica]PYI50976.1 arsenite S-adenosylmethyltransferase [Paenibacillus flagellatus]TYA11075.1 arsenite methyltransferase [Paenibacillus faecis]GIO16402.1 arsenite S-adenosylmethyltransferase [Cohnella xylanilytica]
MNQITNDQIRQNVRSRYKEIALQKVESGSCCSPASSCRGSADDVSSQLGYSSEELTAVPDGANLGLGCGNPQAIAELKPGEVVLDLGSGGGFDCFLASRQVGETGHVIGVDMTPEMVSRARNNAVKGGFTNTDFRLGEIEHLPVPDQTMDVIISNCVINLSPDKQQVFHEAFRVLRPGGRLAVSDVVMTAELPAEIKNDLDVFYSGCISGASSVDELKTMLTQSGFKDVVVEPKEESRAFIKDWVPGSKVEDYLASAVIKGVKP